MGNERLLKIRVSKNGAVEIGGMEQLTAREAMEIALTMIAATDASLRRLGAKPGSVRGDMLETLQREEWYEETVADLMEKMDAGS